VGVVQELKPADHELYNQMGVLLRTNGRQEEASHHFIRASRLKPNDADAFFHLGGTHDTLDRHTEALHAYRLALENENKNEARIHNNIGIARVMPHVYSAAQLSLHAAVTCLPYVCVAVPCAFRIFTVWEGSPDFLED